MEVMQIQRMRWGVVFAVSLMLLLFSSSGIAAETWVDEVWNMVAFEKAAYPGSNFDPYFEKLTAIQNGLGRDDQLLVKKEMDHFLKMLGDRTHGIHDVAADEIYNFALMVRPPDESGSSLAPELGITNERLMSVPDHMINTPYEGGPKCSSGGCDYWMDDVFDPGAS
jgi:hypothetical protein